METLTGKKRNGVDWDRTFLSDRAFETTKAGVREDGPVALRQRNTNGNHGQNRKRGGLGGKAAGT